VKQRERRSCDVAVIGCGPAGIAAAVRAAECGARVVVLDEGMQPGGQIWRHRHAVPRAARTWLQAFGAQQKRGRIEHLARTSVADIIAGTPHVISAHGPDNDSSVTAQTVVLAPGARELLLPFPGWTLPGVFGAGGAQALLKSGLKVRGRTVIVAGSGPLLLPVAAMLARAGARVAEVAEQAPAARVVRFAAAHWREPRLLLEAATYRRAFMPAPYSTGTWITRADGAGAVESVVLTDGRTSRAVPCDMLCAGFGLVPASELAVVAGCELRDDFVVVDERQHSSVFGIHAAGEITGIAGADAALAEGEIAGIAAAGRAVKSAERRLRRLQRAAARHRLHAAWIRDAFALRDELRDVPAGGTVVCRCEDVTHTALVGWRSGREARLQTRAGMGPCQGRVCGPAMMYLYGREPGPVRTPVVPVPVATLIDTEE
jgi:D-hydroxyproline dehydrogenase subunit alpha